MATGFSGFGEGLVEFYSELEMRNEKAWWVEHKAVYEAEVRAPMEALCAALAPTYGDPKVFRPYRDTRFSKDKSPYKTNCAATLGGGRVYLAVSADGLYVGSGRYGFEPDDLARYRAAVDAPATGEPLAALTDKLLAKGYELGGEKLKTVARGYPKDHVRGELLKHKGLYGGRLFDPDPWLYTSQALTKVKAAMRDLAPLWDWLVANTET